MRSGDDRDVVALAGELDGACAPQVASTIRELLAGGRRNFVVDLAAVTFLDTAGLQSLIIATDVVSRTGGSLWVTHNARCVRLLKITNQMYRLHITDTRETTLVRPVRPSVRGG